MKKLLLLAAWLLPTMLCAQEASDTSALQQQLKELQQKNDALEKQVERLLREAGELRQAEALARSHYEDIGRLENIIFKQCLLYPLEARYSEKSVSESLLCIERLSLWNNAQFAEGCHTYLDLLRNYGRYNQEVAAFLSSMAAKLEANAWVNDASTERSFRRGLEGMAYTAYYLKRNQEPYESILYLDQVIEAAEQMVVGDRNFGPIDERKFKEIVKKVN